MRITSPDLLAKLNSNLQTPANNAQPRMSVQVSRARSAVVDSTYWTVETIRTKSGLGDISLAPRRLRTYGRPDRIYEIHVDNGIVKTTIREYPDLLSGGWIPQFELGSGSAVALAFDGDWELWRKKWRLKTSEEPWIMWVDASNVLWAQHWDDVSTLVQLATGVTKVKAMRGWKNKYYPERDQGIVVGYIKSDGFLYYRSYCQDATTHQEWEAERKVDAITFQISNVNLFLLNDYRMGFVVQDTTNQIHWLITERNWAGMAIGSETIKATGAEVTVDFDYVDYPQVYEDEYIFAAADEVEAKLLWAMPENSFMAIENTPDEFDNWGFAVLVEFEHDITTPDSSNFNMMDENSLAFQIQTIENISERIYKFTTTDFNNAYGDITVNFLGSGNTKGENGQDMYTFGYSFAPINLVPTFIPLPEVEVIFNE